jgi:hypothetical protein
MNKTLGFNRFLVLILVGSFVSFFGAGSAYADPIGPGGCISGDPDSPSGKCLGSKYTLDNLGPGPLPGNDWLIKLTVDTSQFNNTDPFNPLTPHITNDLLKAVAINVNHTITAVGNPLVVGPANWTTHLGGTNSGGCNDSGNPFACAQANSLADMLSTGSGPYVFEFDVTLTGATTPDMGTLLSHVKAVYVDSTGDFVGQTSASITLQQDGDGGGGGEPVREPSTLLLLGGGLIGLGAMRRWKAGR